MNPTYLAQYRQLYERHWWWRARERIVLDAICRCHQVREGDGVLDVGCGDGLSFDALQRFGTVEGIEVELDAVSPSNPNLDRIHVRPFDETFQPERSFALITMLDVLEHLDNPQAALAHAAGLLSSTGTLVVTVPAFQSLWTRHDDLNHHRIRYTKATLLPLFAAAGLDVVHARYLFQWAACAKLGVRMKEAIIRGEPKPPQIGAEWINRCLLGLTLAEERIARPLRVPFGSSLLVIARRSPGYALNAGPLSSEYRSPASQKLPGFSDVGAP